MAGSLWSTFDHCSLREFQNCDVSYFLERFFASFFPVTEETTVKFNLAGSSGTTQKEGEEEEEFVFSEVVVCKRKINSAPLQRISKT